MSAEVHNGRVLSDWRFLSKKNGFEVAGCSVKALNRRSVSATARYGHRGDTSQRDLSAE
jgi:hypothetical protein